MHQKTYNNPFFFALLLNLLYPSAELFVAWITGSLSLLSDAFHNFGDVGVLLIAWGGVFLERRLASPKKTYGSGKATILAALINAMTLFVMVGAILVKATLELFNPHALHTINNIELVLVTALVGFFVNLATALPFWGSKDVNIRSVLIHLLTDSLISLGVVFSMGMLWFTGWNVLDPIAALLIAMVILWSAWGIMRSSLHLALDGVPNNVCAASVTKLLHTVPEVQEVHDLHIWPLSTTRTAMTVHLLLSQKTINDSLLITISRALQSQFAIHHITIQVETEKNCPTTHSDLLEWDPENGKRVEPKNPTIEKTST